MADYGLRYTAEWRAPMRGRQLYQLYIYKRDYRGEIEELAVAGDVFSLTQGDRDSSELQPIIASELAITLMCLKAGDPYIELFTLDPLGYKVLLAQSRKGADGVERSVVMWEGYLANGSYSQALSRPPYQVQIVANDGFSALKSMPFLDSDKRKLSATLSVKGWLTTLLEPLGLRSMDVWPYDPVAVAQLDNTLSVVGLTTEAIYNAFGENIPTFYDVLESVLQAFGLQLYQSYGRWVVRSAYSLVDYSRPESFQRISQSFGLAEREALTPLYGGGKRGMLSTGSMSMARPLGAIKIEHPDAAYSSMIDGMTKPERWLNAFVRKSDAKRVLTYDGADSTVRQRLVTPAANAYCGQAYVLDGLFSAAPKVELSLGFDIWNRSNADDKVSIGIYAVDPAIDPTSWTLREDGDYRFYVDGIVWAYNPSRKQWAKVPTGYQTTASFLSSSMVEHTLQKSANSYSFRDNVSTWLLTSTAVTFDVVALPDLGIPAYKLVVIIAINNDNLDGVPAEYNLGNPKMKVRQATTAVSANLKGQAVVSSYGIESDSYVQRYTDSFVLPISNTSSIPAIVDVDKISPIYGFVSPTISGRLSDTVTSKVKELRGDVYRQLEGEMLQPDPIDFSSLFRDDDGRVYRPLYIRSILARDIYDVQLREVLPLRPDPSELTFAGPAIRNRVALDSSVIYTDESSLNVYRYDTVSGEVSQLRSSMYKKYLGQGYNCVCVIEELVEGEVYHLYAYNDNGEQLSEVQNVYGTAISTRPTNAQDAQLAAIAAKYNSQCDVWVMIGNIGNNVIYTYVIDGKGGLLAEVECAWKVGKVMSVDDIVLTANGYFVNLYNATSNSYNAVLWCDFAKHELGEYVTWRRAGYRLLGATGRQMLLLAGSEMKLYPVYNTSYAIDESAPIHTLPASEWQYVGMNSALTLFRLAGSDGGSVFDSRTCQTVQLSREDAPAGSKLWLSGSDVFSADGLSLKRKRIRVGEDDSRFANYITADSYRYITADGLIYTVKDR